MENFYKDLYNDLYDGGYHRSGFAGKGLVQFMKKYIDLKDADKLLDIGCSNGTGIQTLNKLAGGNICYGFDPADRAIELCNRNNPEGSKLRYKVGNLPTIPFQDNYFNVIFCSDVFEHLLSKDIDSSLEEIFRVTTDDCHIFLNIATVPEGNRHDKFTKSYKITNLHTTLWNSKSWLKRFDKCNFQKQEIQIQYEKPGKKIRGKDYSNKEGSFCIYLTKK